MENTKWFVAPRNKLNNNMIFEGTRKECEEYVKDNYKDCPFYEEASDSYPKVIPQSVLEIRIRKAKQYEEDNRW